MKVALGTAQFGMPYGVANQSGQVMPDVAAAMLRFAEANGVDMLDTAASYGESEVCLGKAGVQGFKVVTKLPAYPDGLDVTTWADQQIRSSLGRLGVTECYGVLLHRPNQLAGSSGDDIYRALLSLKEKGYVRKIGVSVYSPHELDVIFPRYPVDIVQVPMNVLDRRLGTSGWEHRLKDLGVEVHARSVFLQGLLLMKRESIPARFSPWFEVFDRWNGWLAESGGLTALEVCLAFLACRDSIDRIVIGADCLGHIKQIISVFGALPACSFPDMACADERLLNPSRWPP